MADPDRHLIAAAQDALRQGRSEDARQAMSRLSAAARDTSDAIEILWELAAEDGAWTQALELADRLTEAAPGSEFGPLYRASSLHELNREEEAFETLRAAAERFPSVPSVVYNLACCACKLGRLDDARLWLKRAGEVGGRVEVKLMALNDPDFAPLLDEICAM